jgi:hypothetical protein
VEDDGRQYFRDAHKNKAEAFLSGMEYRLNRKTESSLTDIWNKANNADENVSLINPPTKTVKNVMEKAQKDLMTDIEFEVLTSNLEAKYYNAIKDKVNLVGTAYMEREMNDIQSMKDAFSKGMKKVGKVASEKRVVTFRDEENAIDVKSHFEFIDAKCDFDTDTFVSTIMNAIEKQAEKFNKKREIDPTIKKIEVVKVEEEVKKVEKVEVKSDELTVNIAKNEELKAEIQKKMVGVTDTTKMTALQKVLKKYGATTIDTSKPTEMFEELLKIF